MDMKILIFIAVALVFSHAASISKHFNFHRDLLAGTLNTPSTDFPDKWFQQRLNHFDHTDTSTWKQRYQENDKSFQEGGPILLMLGGEGPAGVHWMTNGLWYYVAEKHNGIMYQLEHRFYGKSHPTPDTSVENLRFLSSEQALADAATFATWLKKIHPGSKLFSFGGSYSGALSAWFRLRYPHIVDGAFSASGPYLAQVDFPEYEQKVQYVTEKAVTSCFPAVQSGISVIMSMFQNEKANLKSTFHLCEDLSDDLNDMYSLIETLLDPIDEAVQYGDDYQDFEGVQRPFKNAKEVCLNMTVSSNPLEGFAQVNRMYLHMTGQKCLDVSYKSEIEMMRKADWNAEGVAGGARQWVWQTCTEFGYYQTMYGAVNTTAPLPLSYFLQQCSDIYGKPYGDKAFVGHSVDNSNIEYGALSLQSSNTIIFNGDFDPWSRLSIDWPLAPNHETYTFVVPQAAHCAVLYPSSPDDTLALSTARKQILDIFDQWITGKVNLKISNVHA